MNSEYRKGRAVAAFAASLLAAANAIRKAAFFPLMAACFATSAPVRAQSGELGATPVQSPAATGRGAGASNRPASRTDTRRARNAYQQGARNEKSGDWQAAYEAYADAVNSAPDNRDYFVHRELARSHLVQMKMDLAEREAVSGRLADARQELLAAKALDPENRTVRERFSQLTSLDPGLAQKEIEESPLAGVIHLEHRSGTRNFDYRGNTQGVYEEVARQFGVEVAFDAELHNRPARLQMSNLDFPTTMRIVEQMTGTFWRPLTKHLFFVADDTTQKRKDYAVSVVRTVLLPASETTDQMTEILRVVREIAGITRSSLDTHTRELTMRASPQAITVASQLIEDLEKPVGELVLEMEVLEVDRNYARELGLTPPETAKTFTLSKEQVQEALSGFQGLVTVLTEVFGQPSSLAGLTATQIAGLLGSGNIGIGSLIPPLVAFGGGSTTFLATLPGAAANFSEMLSLVRHGRRILLRAEDGKAATFFVGERFPVTLGQFSSSLVSTAGNIPGLIATNFPTTELSTGNGPIYVVAGDLNGDGFQDVIVANNTDNTLSVFLGNGDGTFGNAIITDLETGASPVWMATGNFNPNTNSDTFLDLAVVNKSLNSVTILLGKGDGTFTPAPDLPTGNSPVAVAAADFHDTLIGSTLDLAVANQGDNSISIFQGNGDGTFKAPTLLQLPAGFQPSAITTAALTTSGHIDLIVADKGNNSVSVFLGNGDGTFKTRTDYATGTSPVFVAAGDFNGDSVQDLAVANNADNTVSILVGNGDGTFQPQVAFPTGAGPTSLALADYNVDGRLDIAVAASTDNAVSLLLGLGGATFAPQFELAVGTDPVSIVTADFNGDGKPDAATANDGSANASVILNTSTFTGANSLAGTPFPGTEYIDIGVKVKATPRIHPNEEVTLQLNLEITSLTGQAFNTIPVIGNQSFTQTVRLKQDETSAIAGILETQGTTLVTGTPGLATLPGVGFLGGTQNLNQQDTELLILITPRVVQLAARKDHVIYAGRGALEGPGGFAAAPGREPTPITPVQPAPQPPAPPFPQPPQQPLVQPAPPGEAPAQPAPPPEPPEEQPKP